MIIQWDVDGVLADFRAAWRALVKQRYDIDIPDGETTWDGLYDLTGGPHSVDTDATWQYIKQSNHFWGRSVQPLATPEEFARIDRLAQKHQHYFVTARPGRYARLHTQGWLEAQGIGDPVVLLSSRKADAANALAADYVIDDKPGNVLAVYYQSPPERRVYIRNHSFNLFDSEIAGKRIRRVSTVTEFLDDIEAGR